jgi:hypothetical protein
LVRLNVELNLGAAKATSRKMRRFLINFPVHVSGQIRSKTRLP